MNLSGLHTRTQVKFDGELKTDRLVVNHQEVTGMGLARAGVLLDWVRSRSQTTAPALVTSENNFPMGAGIASSASAFAALALAASEAAGLRLSEPELSRLARLGSGSACRSVPGGFVEWLPGDDDQSSYAVSIAPPEHWDLADCVAIISQEHKSTGSTEGHFLANTSPLQPARVADAPRRLDICRKAILERDFQAFSEIVELDSNLMHAVMMTSSPPLFYWQPHSLELMKLVSTWHQEGLPACYTLDAGANVHILCLSNAVDELQSLLKQQSFIQKVIVARPGSGARLVND